MTGRNPHGGDMPRKGQPGWTEPVDQAAPVPMTPEEAEATHGPAEAVAQAYAERQSGDGGACAVASRYGQVNIASLTVEIDPGGAAVVDVRLAGQTESGDPHFRVINPPLLAGSDGRYDPLGALAEAIALHGGAQVKEGRRR